MEKVLVTGAYGFLGRYTVRELLEHGYEVTALGRNAEKLQALENAEGSGICAAPGKAPGILHTRQGDILDHEDLIEACKGMDYVVHCAAYMKGWGKKEDFFRANVTGTENVLDACEINHVKRLVYTSSPSAVPTESNLHMTESDYNEKNRINYYVESKICADKLVRAQTRVPYSMIRPRGLCGIGDEHMIPVLIKVNRQIGIPLFDRGNVLVDLCCIENVALSLRLCMEKEEALGQVYNITNGEPRKITDLAEKMFPKLGMEARYLKLPFFAPMYGLAATLEFFWKLFGVTETAPPITRYDLCTIGRSQVFDITKAKTELGYTPKVTLDQMIEAYAEDYKRTH